MNEQLKTYILELRKITRDAHTCAIGIETEQELLKIYQAEAELLFDKLTDQARALACAQGKPYAPKVHFGQAVLTGVGGQ